MMMETPYTGDYPYEELADGWQSSVQGYCRGAVGLAEGYPGQSLVSARKALMLSLMLAWVRLARRVPPRIRTIDGWLGLMPGLSLQDGLQKTLDAVPGEEPVDIDELDLELSPSAVAAVLPQSLERVGAYPGPWRAARASRVLDSLPIEVAIRVRDALEELAREFPKPRDIVVFGSRATGEGREDSDTDVGLVYPDATVAERYSLPGLGDVEFHFFPESSLADPLDLAAQGMLTTHVPVSDEGVLWATT